MGSVSDEDAPIFEESPVPAWYVWGRVHDEEGESITGAEVSFQFEFIRNRTYPPSVPVFTDGSGFYKSVIQAPADALAMPCREYIPFTLKGTADAPGYGPEEESLTKVSHPKTMPKPLRMDFCLKKGFYIRGRVVRPGGEAVEKARVNTWDQNNEMCGYALTDANGAYAIAIEKGDMYRIHALKHGEGAASKKVEVPEGRDCLIPDLVFSELGTLEGRATDPQGYPICNFLVRAYPEALLKESYFNLLRYIPKAHKNALTETASTEGISYGHCFTDSNGRFRFAGLTPGRYFIAYVDASFVIQMDQADQAEPVDRTLHETGAKDVQVVLRIPRLDITLVDEAGDLIPEAELSCNSQYSWRNVLGGNEVIAVTPGLQQLVAYTWYGLRCEQTVNIPEGKYLTTIEMVLHPRDENAKGILIVRFATEDGKPIKRMAAPKLHIDGNMKKLTSLELDLSNMERNNEGEFVVPLSPDLYRITGFSSGHDYYFKNFEDGITEHFTIVAGQESHINVLLRKGGKLDLTLHWTGRFKGQYILLWRKGEDGVYGNFSYLSSFRRAGGKDRIPYTELKPDTVYGGKWLLEKGDYRLGIDEDGQIREAVDFTVSPGVDIPVEARL